jgi:hypothetical protein
LPASTLFRQGDAADGLYVLTLGSVSVIGHDGASTQRFLSISPGHDARRDGAARRWRPQRRRRGRQLHRAAPPGPATLQRLGDDHPAIAARLHRNIAVHLSRRLRAASAGLVGQPALKIPPLTAAPPAFTMR